MVKVNIYEGDPTKLVIRQGDFEWRYKELIASTPTASWRKDKFLLSLSWPTALALQSNLGQHLEVGQDVLDWMNEYYNKRILPSYNLRSVIGSDEGYEFLYPHQKVDVKFIEKSRRMIIANDVGSGKSISSVAGLRNIKENLGEEVFPLLIVAPNSTKIGWGREFEKAWPGRKVHILSGTATQRKKIFKDFDEQDGEVLILNWEQVRHHSRLLAYGGTALKRCTDCGGLDENVKATACEAHDKELNFIDFNSVIGDEIHRISDPSTKIARSFKSATGNAEFRIGLSGTPINNTPDQLYSALNWLYPEAYPSKVKFIDRFCILTPSQWGPPIISGIRPDREQEFFSSIDPILRRMPKEVILPFLPPVVRTRRDVEMGTKQAKAYKQMQEKMIAELDDGDFTFTTSALVKDMRLLQFSSAYATVDYEDILDTTGPFPLVIGQKEKLTLSDPSCKIDAFMDDLPDFGDSSVVVFAQHKQLINLLSARMTKAGIEHGLITGDQDTKERQAYMDSFQAGNLKYILVTIQAGGTGITLTRADTMVFLQRSYNMIDNVQAEGRSNRIGSEIHDQINIIDYVTKDSADDGVIEAIDRKIGNLQFILRDADTIRDFILGKLPEEGPEEAPTAE